MAVPTVLPLEHHVAAESVSHVLTRAGSALLSPHMHICSQGNHGALNLNSVLKVTASCTKALGYF